MGKRFKRNKGKNQKNGEEKPPKERQNYEESAKDNETFFEFYKLQNIIPNEEEFEQFRAHLKESLPVTFRITGTRSQGNEILNILKNRFIPSFEGKTIEGEALQAPFPLPWYPDEFGWHVPSSRTNVRKCEEFQEFHKFLVGETDVGNVSRQEAVSMVPPLLLGVQPHHYVLDMCAAPGSKTNQLIEALHSEDLNRTKGEDLDDLEAHLAVNVPKGLIIANDANQKRSYTLVHNTKRLKSPCLMVTNHEAQLFPNINLQNEDGSDKYNPLRFDRILCDVPCSGDGTLRKNITIWKDWTSTNGYSLHNLQVNILSRGIQMLKPGGRIVYSTCSLNPIENEAVIATVLQKYAPYVTLKDVSNELPELKRTAGLSTWKVLNTENKEVEDEEQLGAKRRKWMVPTFFPPSDPSALNLDRCVRIYPHHQNTGAFFVAVLEKSLDAPFRMDSKAKSTDAQTETNPEAENEEAEIQAESADASDAVVVDGDNVDSAQAIETEPNTPETKEQGNGEEQKQSRYKNGKYVEEPFIFLKQDGTEAENIRKHYGLEKFPLNQLLVRSESNNNGSVNFVSSSISKILKARNAHRIRTVYTGIKTFIRTDASRNLECHFRIQSEGAGAILSTLKPELVINATLKDMHAVLNERNPFFSRLSEHLQTKLQGLSNRSVVIVFDPKTHEPETGAEYELCPYFNTRLLYPLWVAPTSVNLLLNDNEKRSLNARLFK